MTQETFTQSWEISFRVNQRDLQDFDYMVHAVGVGFAIGLR